MRILLTGASGQIGQKLGPQLRKNGFEVICLTRDQVKNRKSLEFATGFIELDLSKEKIKPSDLKNVDVIIHLMGESIDGYWTVERKKRISDSRIFSSRNLAESVSTLPESQKKPVIISASAMGIYADSGDRIVKESEIAPPGDGDDFLAFVCREWEAPFQNFSKNLAVRTVQLRFPMILDPDFGALQKLVGLFKKRLGAVLASGKQWVSWAASEDIIAIIIFAIQNEKMSGAYNCSASGVVTNRELTQNLAQVLGVLTLPAVPRFMLKVLFGEMSLLFLNSVRMSSERLIQAGYQFQFNDLSKFLQQSIKKI